MKRALALAAIFVCMVIVDVSSSNRSVDAATSSTFTVNSTADVSDANPGNGICDTGGGVCTLRAAIQEANAHSGADTIKIPSGFYQLTQVAEAGFYTSGLVITTPMTILGAGADATIIDGNGAAFYARVFDITGTVTISGVTIQHGYAYDEGGGISNDSQLTIINSAIISNTTNGLNDFGGGIVNFGALTVTNSLVRGNTTGNHNAYGGGIMNASVGAVVVIDSTISDNSTFAHAASPYSPGYGGGLYGSSMTIMNSTISGNTAAVGGGVYNPGGSSIIINSTISGNNSDSAGGGIYNGGGTLDLYNVTVANNLANADEIGSAIGGGVANGGGTFNFRNSIIALNGKVVVPGPFYIDSDCAGTITSQSHNIMYDTSDCSVIGSYTQADPALGSLQNNGGHTQTHALLANSPAIDAGESPYCTDQLGAPITVDQRGVTRPANGCDIGAFEYQTKIFLPLVKK